MKDEWRLYGEEKKDCADAKLLREADGDQVRFAAGCGAVAAVAGKNGRGFGEGVRIEEVF